MASFADEYADLVPDLHLSLAIDSTKLLRALRDLSRVSSYDAAVLEIPPEGYGRVAFYAVREMVQMAGATAYGLGLLDDEFFGGEAGRDYMALRDEVAGIYGSAAGFALLPKRLLAKEGATYLQGVVVEAVLRAICKALATGSAALQEEMLRVQEGVRAQPAGIKAHLARRRFLAQLENGLGFQKRLTGHLATAEKHASAARKKRQVAQLAITRKGVSLSLGKDVMVPGLFFATHYRAFQAINRYLTALKGSGITELAVLGEEQKRKLEQADFLMPLVGMFSSGKTTLVNAILGKDRFRTAQTHNTAIATRLLFAASDEQERCVFDYRQGIDLELLEPCDAERTAKVAAEDFLVEEVSEPESGCILTCKDDLTGRRKYVFIDTRFQPLDSKVRVGARFKKGERLTEGQPAEQCLRSWASSRKPIKLRISGKVLLPLSRLLERRILKRPQLHVWRRTGGQQDGATQEQDLLTDPLAIIRFLDHIFGVSGDRDSISTDDQLDGVFRAIIRADVDVSALPAEHSLQSDEDWAWFQGGDGVQVGFAEQLENGLLVRQCRVYLKNEFFRNITLADTPGLGSVTDRHDDVTEQFMRNGNAFVLMMNARTGPSSAETWTLLTRFLEILSDGKGQKISSEEMVKHVFILINWFRGQANEQTVRIVMKDFEHALHNQLGWNSPRLYVSNLRKALADGEGATVQGYGDYEDFKRDLEHYVGQEGVRNVINRVLDVVYREMERATARILDEMQGVRKLQEQEKELEAVLQRLKGQGLLSRCLAVVSHELTAYRQLKNECFQRVEGIVNYDDVGYVGAGLQPLGRQINERRDTLAGVASRVERLVESAVGGGYDWLNTEFYPPAPAIEYRPTSAFASRLDEIAARRPRGLRVPWDWVLSKLGGGYIGWAKSEIRAALRNLLHGLDEEINAACGILSAEVERYVGRVGASLKDRCEWIKGRLCTPDGSQEEKTAQLNIVADLKSLLSKTRMEIEAILTAKKESEANVC